MSRERSHCLSLENSVPVLEEFPFCIVFLVEYYRESGQLSDQSHTVEQNSTAQERAEHGVKFNLVICPA